MCETQNLRFLYILEFKCDFFSLLLRKKDYALFRHVLSNNIGEEPRHLAEWNALQSLPVEELNEYKKKILVHFGYDKKDATPTTYRFTIDIESILLHFCTDASDYVADIDCFELKYSLEKLMDKVSRQKLICASIQLEHTSCNPNWARYKKLFFPLESLNLLPFKFW